jgi:hypothetical protein
MNIKKLRFEALANGFVVEAARSQMYVIHLKKLKKKILNHCSDEKKI